MDVRYTTDRDAAGLLFLCLTAVNDRAPCVSYQVRGGGGGGYVSARKPKAGNIMGYRLVRGKGHKSLQVWNEMIQRATRGFKCQLGGNTSGGCFFLTSFPSTHSRSFIFPFHG